MAFEIARNKPSKDVSPESRFDLADFNDRLPKETQIPSLKERIAQYGNTPGVEYPAGVAPQPEADLGQTESSHEQAGDAAEAADMPDGPVVRDNGLGIMVVDYPAAEASQPDASPPQEINHLETQPQTDKLLTAKLSFSGLKKFLASARQLPTAATQRISANLITGLSGFGEKLTLAEHKTARKSIAVIALGGLAVAAAAYTAHKTGINFGTSRSHEALQQTLPVKAPHHPAEVHQQIQSVAAAKPPAHHETIKSLVQPNHKAVITSEASQTFVIEPGHGFTQELSESFSPKGSRLSPERSYRLFTAIRQHFGDHGILKHGKGLVDGTYDRDGQEYISRSGRARWAGGVSQFARTWLRHNGS
jgi:hypothetical protein